MKSFIKFVPVLLIVISVCLFSVLAVSSTKTEIIPVIPAFIDFDPDVLNLKAKEKMW